KVGGLTAAGVPRNLALVFALPPAVRERADTACRKHHTVGLFGLEPPPEVSVAFRAGFASWQTKGIYRPMEGLTGVAPIPV
ncbi:MAG: hypothetical protein ABI488_16240, partial [Polyangiaceae bacterium]